MVEFVGSANSAKVFTEMMDNNTYRGKRIDNGEWVYGFLYETENAESYILKQERLTINYKCTEGITTYVTFIQVDPNTVGKFSSLYDRKNKEIFEGDILEFQDHNGTWRAPVEFTRGVFGLNVNKPVQIKNPDGWKEKHDKVRSRWWATEWGYEEYGTAFTYRKPLSQKSVFTGNVKDYKDSELNLLSKTYGYGKYYVIAEVIGNIHDDPELLEVK